MVTLQSIEPLTLFVQVDLPASDPDKSRERAGGDNLGYRVTHLWSGQSVL